MDNDRGMERGLSQYLLSGGGADTHS